MRNLLAKAANRVLSYVGVPETTAGACTGTDVQYIKYPDGSCVKIWWDCNGVYHESSTFSWFCG